MTTRTRAPGLGAIVAAGVVLFGLGAVFVAAGLDRADKLASVIGVFAALIGLCPLGYGLITRVAPAAEAGPAGGSGPAGLAGAAAVAGADRGGSANAAAAGGDLRQQALSHSVISQSTVIGGDYIVAPGRRSSPVLGAFVLAIVVVAVLLAGFLSGRAPWQSSAEAAPESPGSSSSASPGPGGPSGQPSPTPGVTAGPWGGLGPVSRATATATRITATTRTSGTATHRPTTTMATTSATATAVPARYTRVLDSGYDKIDVTREGGIELRDPADPADFQVHPDEAAPKLTGAAMALLGTAASCADVELTTGGVEFDVRSATVVVCGRTHLGLAVRLQFSPWSAPGDGPHQLLTVAFSD
jgi:hypothetical protein